jgi:hypothetical protein
MSAWTYAILVGIALLLPVVIAWARVRLLARRNPHRDALTHRITVEPNGDGQPGASFLAPRLSTYLGAVDDDGVRSECTVVLSRRQSVLRVVCLGPANHRELEDDAAFAVTQMEERGLTRVEGPTFCSVLRTLAVTYTMKVPDRRMLTAWRLDHEGWRYEIAVLLARRDGKPQMETALSILSTWRWLSRVPAA